MELHGTGGSAASIPLYAVQIAVALGARVAYHDGNEQRVAMARALAIEPKNPDVLTDQGVMYRELHQVDRAVENFEKASKLDPGHVQSVFNLGVVWAMDMKRSDKAIEAWNRVIQMAPGSPQAAQARELIARLRAQGGQ